MGYTYHVAKNGNDWQEGSKDKPFLTISMAAEIAMPGDTIVVHEGVYREWVKPENSGTGEMDRITYEAAEGEHVVIKGSERIQSWKKVEGTVWKAVIPVSFFGNYNPYVQTLNGDWFISPDNTKEPWEDEQGVLRDFPLHTGEVYLNGKSLYEAGRLKDVLHPVMRKTGVTPPWTHNPESLLHPEDSIYQWYTETDNEQKITTIYANFHGIDPNEELTEINVRKCCFYPTRTGRNYITVRGFEMTQAACPWTPPTADQPGLLGVNWSKGWIIENNIIHDAKCSGISIGKEESTGHNLCTRTQRKPGYQYQMEAVFRARRIGWSKDTIGSHIIRNNVIYDCGQNGIVGHMGCAFSTIEHNHIYNIAVKHEYFGYEIAGIKLHAAIDIQILNNNIHNSTLGTWLDWQAQGARISRNLYYENNRDLMIEVTHGPYMVDNNIFASAYNFDNVAQGGAYLHNLCCGIMRRIPVLDRSTPYHFPHSTEVAGCATVFSGDDRLYQNIFVGNDLEYAKDSFTGTIGYNGHPSSWEEYLEKIIGLGNEDHEKFKLVKQAVFINRNVYFCGAPSYENEQENYVSGINPQIKITETKEGTWLDMNIDKEIFSVPTSLIRSETLGSPRITEAPFDAPDGSFIVFDEDFFGSRRGKNPVPGPIETLQTGHNHIRVW